MLHPVLTTAPAATAFDLNELKRQLRIPLLVTDDDILLAQYIDRAVDYLDGYEGVLGRCLVNQDWTTYHGGWAGRLRSPFPDCSAAVVKYYDTTDTLITVDASDYIVYPDYIRFRDAFDAPTVEDDRDDPIQVIWTCGYGDDHEAIPNDLRHGAYTLCGHWFENREAVVPNDRRVEMDQLPYAIKDMIGKYRTGFSV